MTAPTEPPPGGPQSTDPVERVRQRRRWAQWVHRRGRGARRPPGEYMERPPWIVRLFHLQEKLARDDVSTGLSVPPPPRPLGTVPRYSRFHERGSNDIVNVPWSVMVWKRPWQTTIIVVTVLAMAASLAIGYRHLAVILVLLSEAGLGYLAWSFLQAYWFIVVHDVSKGAIYRTRGQLTKKGRLSLINTILAPETERLGSEDIRDTIVKSYRWATVLGTVIRPLRNIGWLRIVTVGEEENWDIRMVGNIKRVSQIFEGVDRMGGQNIQHEAQMLMVAIARGMKVSDATIDSLFGIGTAARWKEDSELAEQELINARDRNVVPGPARSRVDPDDDTADQPVIREQVIVEERWVWPRWIRWLFQVKSRDERKGRR